MNPTETRELGRTGVRITRLGLGGAPLGSLFVEVGEEEAVATVRRAWDVGVRLFDTAPYYGLGLSELRMGAGLRGRPRDEFVLSTKVGRWLKPPADRTTFSTPPWIGGNRFDVVFDYTYDGIMRSYEQSLQRLGVATFDLAVIHDLDSSTHGTDANVAAYEAQLTSSGWHALDELKRAGQIRAIGAGVNERGTIGRFLDRTDVDFFLVAMPYTLLDQDVLADEFPRLEERGIGVIIGSVFASGILATGPIEGATYAYAVAPPTIIERVRRIQAVCDRHDVPLAAAALQFPLAHPSVASVIPGGFKPEQVERTTEAFRFPIPGQLWAELRHEGLLRADAPAPS